jgi:plastocyanin
VPYTPTLAQVLKLNNMITLHDASTLGQADSDPFIITLVTISSSEDGVTRIQVQGKNPLIWLKRRVITSNNFSMTSSPTAIVQALLTAEVLEPQNSERIIPNLSCGSTPEYGQTTTYVIQQQYANLLTSITQLLKVYNLGQNITFNLNTQKFSYNILQGVDRSLNEADVASMNTQKLPPVVFSPQYGNITGDSFEHTDVNLVNVVYGSVEIDSTEYTTVTGSAIGLNRFEGSITASSTTETPITTSNYAEVLTLLAEQKMEKDAENKTSMGTIKANNSYKYKIDFNLGDTVTYLNTDWGVNVTGMVTEVNQQWSARGKVTQVQLGKPLPTIADILGISAD